MYLQGLPLGSDSYPDAQAKASLVHEVLQLAEGRTLDPALPSVVHQLFAAPPPVSGWVPEVLYRTLMLGILDARGLSDADALRVMRAKYRQILSSPLYSVLFGLVGAPRFLKSIDQRWRQFHRGTEMQATVSGRDVTIEFLAPTPMFEGLVGEIQKVSMEVILARVTGNQNGVLHVERRPRGYRYVGTW